MTTPAERFVQRADEVLLQTCETARRLVPSHQAAVTLMVPGDWGRARKVFSLSERYAEWKDFHVPARGVGVHALPIPHGECARMTQAELVAHPAWRDFDRTAKTHPPMRGWLAVPLFGDDGLRYGLLQLSDRADGGDFTERDADDLRGLARIAEIGLSALGRELRAATGGSPFDLRPSQVTNVLD